VEEKNWKDYFKKNNLEIDESDLGLEERE